MIQQTNNNLNNWKKQLFETYDAFIETLNEEITELSLITSDIPVNNENSKTLDLLYGIITQIGIAKISLQEIKDNIEKIDSKELTEVFKW